MKQALEADSYRRVTAFAAYLGGIETKNEYREFFVWEKFAAYLGGIETRLNSLYRGLGQVVCSLPRRD